MHSTSQSKDYPARPDIDAASVEPGSSLALMLDMVGERKKVLDVGCASGYLAKLMAAKQCDVTGLDINPAAPEAARAYCARTILADLDVTSLGQAVDGLFFDVIVFGDILEHLRAPARALEEARAALLDDGFVVASIPNIAHGAIRLALLSGNFDYKEYGLLDDSHLRFFTAKSVDELFLDAGYRIETIERTQLPIFESSDLLPEVRAADYPASVVEEIESDPESTTLQFVVKAFPISNEAKYRTVAKRFLTVNTALSSATTQIHAQEREIATLRTAVAEREQQVAEREQQVAETREHLAAADREMRKAQSDFNQLAPQVQDVANLRAQLKELTESQDLYKVQAETSDKRLQTVVAETHRMEIALVRAQEQLQFARTRLAESSASFNDQHNASLEEIALLRASAVGLAEEVALAKGATLELDSLRRVNTELTEAVAAERLATQRAASELQLRADALQVEQAQGAQAAARVDQLSEDLEKERAAAQTLDERLRVSMTDAQHMEVSLVRVQEQLKFAREQFAESSAAFNSQHNANLEEIALLRASAAGLAEEIATAKTALLELESLRAENRVLTEALTTERLATESTKGALANALEAAQAQRAQLVARIDQLSAELAKECAAGETAAAELQAARIFNDSLSKQLIELSERFAAHARASIDQTQAEAKEVALQIELIQTGRLWNFKHFLRKVLA